MTTDPLDQTAALISKAQDLLDRLRGELGSDPTEAGVVRAAAAALRALHDDPAAAALPTVIEAVALVADACESAGEPDYLHPSTLETMVDALTGAEFVLEGASLGDLTRAIRPEVIDAVRALRTTAAGESAVTIRFRRVDEPGPMASEAHVSPALTSNATSDPLPLEQASDGPAEDVDPQANDPWDVPDAPASAPPHTEQVTENDDAGIGLAAYAAKVDALLEGYFAALAEDTPSAVDFTTIAPAERADETAPEDTTSCDAEPSEPDLSVVLGSAVNALEALDDVTAVTADELAIDIPTGVEATIGSASNAFVDDDGALSEDAASIADRAREESFAQSAGTEAHLSVLEAIAKKIEALDEDDGALASVPNTIATAASGLTPGAMPDPNVALDPTGGMLDPNVALDPTGGMPDPNVALDPTGGMLDPNVALDPTGGGPALGEDIDAWGSTPVMVQPEQVEMLQFMVADVRQVLEEFDAIIAEAMEFTSRQDAAGRLAQAAQDMRALNDFFEFKSFRLLLDVVSHVAERLPDVPDAVMPELIIRVRGVANLLDQYCRGLEVGLEMSWPLRTLRRRLDLLLAGKPLHPLLVGWHNNDPERLLELDGVVDGTETPPKPPSDEDDGSTPRATAAPTARPASNTAEAAVPTVRVSQPALQGLLDLARQLVLNKNQIQSLATEARTGQLAASRAEALAFRAAEYARLVEGLQQALTETRVQPIGTVLDRFERVVRDCAGIADKQIDFVVAGGQTRVDKFMLDAISEPLGRLIRHAAGRSIEAPAQREAAGKPRRGTLKISAEDRGSHVIVTVEDDGDAPSLAALREAAKGFEGRGGLDPDAIDDDAVAALPLRAWFESSEVAGVAEAVENLGGTVAVGIEQGRGTRCRLALPVPGAVLAAMNVRIGRGVYCVPVKAIREIINLADVSVHTIRGERSVRVRDSVFPLIDGRQRFGEPAADAPGFAVVVTADGLTAAIQVDRVLGSQEVVIEPIDVGEGTRGAHGPFLGATIQNDSSVALVIDVAAVIGGAAHHAARAGEALAAS